MRSGREETLPYSLSRWTDVPAAKWDWFKRQLAQGWMVAFDPRTAVPGYWSLKREDTLGLIFWTKNPLALVRDAKYLGGYPFVVHVTLTGWQEAEGGAPNLEEGLDLFARAVEALGPSHIVWRFSPVPLVQDVVERFGRIASRLSGLGVKDCYVSFLHNNDLMKETRSLEDRLQITRDLISSGYDIAVKVCSDDPVAEVASTPKGVCESGERFSLICPKEDCGCALSVDPFTTNESCSYRCSYCYSADRSLNLKKRDTTSDTSR